MISASNALRTSARKAAIEPGASLAHYDGLTERPFDAGFLGGRNGRMATAMTAAVMSPAAAMMAMPAAVVHMTAAMMAMAIPIRIMPPVIAAVVTIIAPSVVPMTAEIDPKRTDTDILRRSRPGIEKGGGDKQG